MTPGLPTTNSTDKLHAFLECVIVHSPAHRSPGELVSSWDMLLSLHRLLDHSVKCEFGHIMSAAKRTQSRKRVEAWVVQVRRCMAFTSVCSCIDSTTVSVCGSSGRLNTITNTIHD